MKRILFIGIGLSFNLWAGVNFPELSEFKDRLNSNNCVSQTDQINNLLSGVEKDSRLRNLLYQDHSLQLEELWDAKIVVHEKMQRMKLSPGCVEGLRHFNINLRKLEDTIEQNFYHRNKGRMNFPDHAFGQSNPHLKRNPKFKNFDLIKDLKSGDIILSRGNAYTSAAISALGEYDTQFSHLSVVYRDPKGKLWTIESHIEVGVFVRPLEDHIRDKNFRTMILRYQGPVVARKAAEYIFNKVKKASDTTGNINYDFAFDAEDSSELFCSEVASHAFSEVTNNQVKLPMFSSRITKKKPDFVAQLGITVEESFIPADLEVDPRFDLIAEWKNAAKITDNLQKDAVLQAMFLWSDQYGYVMNQASSVTSLTYRNIAWPLRRVPFIDKYFENKLPKNMSRKLVGYFGVLESIGKHLQKKLGKVEALELTRSGDHLTSEEKYIYLNEVRIQDRKENGVLHYMYRPVKKK